MTSHMRAFVLGAAAGGGLPQWNCGCRNCNDARSGKIPAQSQSSLAVSANGSDWAILNASPDIRTQIQDCAHLHPTGLRETPIKSVLVTNGDIDHTAGLLILREKQPFNLYATAEILGVLNDNPIFSALDRELVRLTPIELETPFELVTGVQATLFAVPGKVPLYLEGEVVVTDLEGEQTVGVKLEAGDKRIWYIPGCAKLTDALKDRLRGEKLIFFDGTVFENDEMARTRVGQKTGARMGHMAMTGPNGSMREFSSLGIERKIFVHLNNTNPVWQPDSAERRIVEEAGWEIGHDGLEVVL